MLARVVLAVPLIVIGITVGTACQHLGILWFGERLGFELASILGLSPLVAAIVLVRHRWPNLLRLRRAYSPSATRADCAPRVK